MDITSFKHLKRKALFTGCFFGILGMGIFCLFDSQYFVSLLFQSKDLAITKMESNSDISSVNLFLNVLRIPIIIGFDVLFYYNFFYIKDKCDKHILEFSETNTFTSDMKRDYTQLGILSIVCTAIIPITIKTIFLIIESFM